MAKSEITKKLKNRYELLQVLSIMITAVPLAVFAGIGFVNGTPQEKIVMSLGCIVGIACVVINMLLKWHIRTGLWISIFGLCYAFKQNVDTIMYLTAIMALTTALDEFVITPLAKRYKEKYKINKEIDKRL